MPLLISDHEWMCVCGNVWEKGEPCRFILCGMEDERQRAMAKVREARKLTETEVAEDGNE